MNILWVTFLPNIALSFDSFFRNKLKICQNITESALLYIDVPRIRIDNPNFCYIIERG